jgi:hypothetical protein
MTLGFQAIRTEQERAPALRVPRPVSVTQLGDTVSTLLEARADADFQIESLFLANITATLETVTIYFVPADTATDTTQAIVRNFEVPANSRVTLFSRDEPAMLDPGMSLRAQCSSASAVNIYGLGYDYQGVYAT